MITVCEECNKHISIVGKLWRGQVANKTYHLCKACRTKHGIRNRTRGMT